MLRAPLFPHPSFSNPSAFEPVIPLEATAIIARIESLSLKPPREQPPPWKKARINPATGPALPRPPIRLSARRGLEEETLKCVADYMVLTEPGFVRKLQVLSRFWYSYAHNQPHFWTHITIHDYHSLQAMKIHYVRRSCTEPLYVSVRSADQDRTGLLEHQFFEQVVSLLTPHIARIRTLTVRAGTGVNLSFILRQLVKSDLPGVKPEQASKLKKVDAVLFRGYTLRPETRIGQLILSYPKGVQELSFHRMIFPPTKALRALRSLHISRPEVYCNTHTVLAQLFATCPNLHDLQIDTWISPVRWFSQAQHNFPAARLESLTIRRSAADNIAKLLQYLNAPRLARLSIELDSAAWPSAVCEPHAAVLQAVAALQRVSVGPALEELALRYVHPADPDVVHMLSCLPALRTLTFEHSRVTDAILEALSDCTAWVCPALHTVRLSGCTPVTGNAVKKLVWDRRLGWNNGEEVTPIRELVLAGCEGVMPKHLPFCRGMGEVEKVMYYEAPLDW